MTPLIAELHNAHKERLARFARAALTEKPCEIVVRKPEPVAVRPKSSWFSIVSDAPVLDHTMRAPTVRDIQRVVCAHYGVSLRDLLSRRKTAIIVRPRQVSMFLARELTMLSIPQIGRVTGGRDHSTAHHAIQKIERLRHSDEELARTIWLIRERLA